MVKNCDLGLEMLPSAYGLGQYFQDLCHSFTPYGPPSRLKLYYDRFSSRNGPGILHNTANNREG